MSIHGKIISFNAGELSPLLDGRDDIAKYNQGCRKLENFLVTAYGAVVRRPGLQFIAAAKAGNKQIRLVPFKFSIVQTYMLEFGEHYIRFFKDGEQIFSGTPSVPYEIVSPYAEADLPELKYVQSADVMFIVHPKYAPRKLSRTAHTAWTLVELDYVFPPLMDPNLTETTITPSAIIGNITLTASAAIFKSTHVGAYWQLIHVRSCNKVAGSFTALGNSDTLKIKGKWQFYTSGTFTGVVKLQKSTDNGTNWTDIKSVTSENANETGEETADNVIYRAAMTTYVTGTVAYTLRGMLKTDNETTGMFEAVGESWPVQCKGTWNFLTHGTWTGTVIIQRSFDAGTTWEDYRTYTGSDDRNMDANGNEKKDNAYYRVKMEKYVSGALEYEFRADSYYHQGIVKITSVTDGTHAGASVIKEIGKAEKTKEWNEGAWSEENGYPAAVAFYEERLMFAGSGKQPQTVWGSKTSDWNNFETGDFDDDALAYTIAADDVNAIRWMVAQSSLLIGTEAAEWKLSASSADKPLTPTNVTAKRQSCYGSKNIQAQLINDAVLFVQRQGRKVREFVYNFEKDGYVSPDLTMLANHVTAPGIVYTAFQSQPDAVLWCVRSDGELSAMTYERDQDVVGWHRHVTAGAFESVAVIPGTDGDEVWCAVKRHINGADVRYVERFGAQDFAALNTAFFVDSGIYYNGAPVTEITGLDHLEGSTVAVLADGAVMPSAVVADGKITLPVAASRVAAGLPYTSHLQPMKITLDLQNGTSQGRPKRISSVTVRFYRSASGKVKGGNGNFMPVDTRKTTDVMDNPAPLFTGDYKVAVSGGYETDGNIEIKQDLPLPMTIIAIYPIYEVHS